MIGCSNLSEENMNITSYGTNRNWEGHLEVKPNNNNLNETILTLKYTGSKMDDVKDSNMYLASKKCMKWQLKMLLARCISPPYLVIH